MAAANEISAMPKTVLVALIDHEHGTNVGVFTSRAGALSWVADYARQWWQDALELDETLPETPPADDASCSEMYFEAMRDAQYPETFQIQEAQVDPQA
jgi:hypothetical protein